MPFCVLCSHSKIPKKRSEVCGYHETQHEKVKGCECFVLYKVTSSDCLCHRFADVDRNYRKGELPHHQTLLSQLLPHLRMQFSLQRSEN